jgi:hypothetical protein
MTLRQKSWIWILSWPFAHANYTTIGDTIYFPNGKPPSQAVIAHETIHSKQQEAVGFWVFALLYLLVLPFLWNPWRWKWELEAGTKVAELRSYRYGWLMNR